MVLTLFQLDYSLRNHLLIILKPVGNKGANRILHLPHFWAGNLAKEERKEEKRFF